MSFSIYYEAARSSSLTAQEEAAVQSIIEQYCAQYPFSKPFEEFGVYEYSSDSDIVFSGSTKLPDSEPDVMFQAALHWLQCLTKITELLIDCRWSASFEEVDLIYETDTGWRFPTDQE